MSQDRCALKAAGHREAQGIVSRGKVCCLLFITPSTPKEMSPRNVHTFPSKVLALPGPGGGQSWVPKTTQSPPGRERAVQTYLFGLWTQTAEAQPQVFGGMQPSPVPAPEEGGQGPWRWSTITMETKGITGHFPQPITSPGCLHLLTF